VTSYPVFLVYNGGTLTDTIRGADRNKLERAFGKGGKGRGKK
jgi:hypothetical protein